jgi:hypothetical protein
MSECSPRSFDEVGRLKLGQGAVLRKALAAKRVPTQLQAGPTILSSYPVFSPSFMQRDIPGSGNGHSYGIFRRIEYLDFDHISRLDRPEAQSTQQG